MWPVFVLTVSVMFLPVCTLAQIHTSSRILGMGTAGTAGRGYTGDVLGNPAGVTSADRPALLVAHHYMYYQPEVSSQVGLVVLPFRIASLGLVSVHFGLESAYRFTSVGAVFGKQFGPDLSVAWAAHYRYFQIPGYREERGAAVDIGVHYALSPGWRVGGVVRNMPLVAFAADLQHVSSSEMRIGVAYRPGDGLDLALDLAYQESDGIILYAGLDYTFVPETLFLRLGLSSENRLSPFAGLGIGWKKFRLDAASSFHVFLGMSPQIDLSYAF